MDDRLPNFVVTEDLASSEFDSLVVVAPKVSDIHLKEVNIPLASYLAIDTSAEKGVFVVPCKLPLKKIIFSSPGLLDNDYEDVRCYASAAKAGVQKALATGSRAPLLLLHATAFQEARLVSVLGALEAVYVPLEVREVFPEKAKKVEKIGVYGNPELGEMMNLAQALEAGRLVSRDIGGSDPERMAAQRVERYILREFEDTRVAIEVIKGQSTFEKEYPCLAAVNRCASTVPRHDGRVIWLTYEPEGPVEKTVMLVGKGITYDTGGVDIKVGGSMAGMSRDKCGAANVAGFLKVVSLLNPKNVKVVGAMAMVRNSIGSNAYVSDEIITSRAGVRIRVVNTDAEGRMAMVDVLAHMKEKALREINPHLMTIATLTGHAALAVGPYTAVMDNGVAKKEQFALKLQSTGETYGDMFEVSTIRKEDFEFIKDKSGAFVEVLHCDKASSSRTPRGHQYPAAFMMRVSGLTNHQLVNEKPLKYSHLDVAGTTGDLPEPTSGSTVVGLSMHFLL